MFRTSSIKKLQPLQTLLRPHIREKLPQNFQSTPKATAPLSDPKQGRFISYTSPTYTPNTEPPHPRLRRYTFQIKLSKLQVRIRTVCIGEQHEQNKIEILQFSEIFKPNLPPYHYQWTQLNFKCTQLLGSNL